MINKQREEQKMKRGKKKKDTREYLQAISSSPDFGTACGESVGPKIPLVLRNSAVKAPYVVVLLA